MKVPKPAYVTSMTDDEWSKSTLQERVLRVASSCKGVKEVGNNAGTAVGKFLSSVGLGTGYSWCAAFVYWCLIQAGADPKKLPHNRKAAGVINWISWAGDRITKEPRRGRLFFWLDGGHGHIGFVLDKCDSFKTIEGNTNDAGSREGDGVYERIRTRTMLMRHERYGFIRLNDLE